MKLRIFFDSHCPLCVKEMHLLTALDVNDNLAYTDIHAPNFQHEFPHIDPLKANTFLHAENDKGDMLYGLDVSCQAWALVNHYRWLKVLRWPVISWFADIAYRIFAKHRYTISYWLSGQGRCEACENVEVTVNTKITTSTLEEGLDKETYLK
jgi:predicted DCC family thiol-disulfide oxidoreductase YuxK